jgi:chromosome segregation ATPase
MKSTTKLFFGILFLSVFGLWGCSRPPTTNPAQDRVKVLEHELKLTREAKDRLNDQYKLTQNNAKGLQEEVNRLQGIVKSTENDRDQIHSQYETFRKSLKDLIGQAETTLNPNRNSNPSASSSSTDQSSIAN